MHRNSVRFTLHIVLILASGFASGLLGDVFSWWNYFIAFGFGMLMGAIFGSAVELLHENAVERRKFAIAMAKAAHPAGSSLFKD